MNSSKQGIPTDGSFWQEYSCLPMDEQEESSVGGKIFLPSESLSEIMATDRYGLPSYTDSGRGSPMIFEISSKSGRRSFCGVMEFIAPEGKVMVPSWMMKHLELDPEQKVQIRKVILPKGIFVQLQPQFKEFNNKGDDLKATLEWVLRRFVALSVGDTIQVEHDNVVLKFNVLACTPDRAIAITDQDVCVDFVAPLDGSEVNPGLLGVKSKAPLTWSQEIAAEEEKEKEKHKEASVTVGQMDVLKGVEGVDYKLCTNCQQPVPPGGITMHELRCQRINWYCVLCNVVVLKTAREEHNDKYHSCYICEWCGEEMEKRLILEHKKSDCSGRNVACRFCHLKMQYRKLWSHEQNCGAVTEVCPKCRNRYSRRDFDAHASSCSGTTETYKIPHRRAPTNDMMLCEKCKQPFSNFEDLQVHILTEHMEDLGEFAGLFGGDIEEKNGESKKYEIGEEEDGIEKPSSDVTETEKEEKSAKEVVILPDEKQSEDHFTIPTVTSGLENTTSTTNPKLTTDSPKKTPPEIVRKEEKNSELEPFEASDDE